jgi:hypothetical protein
MRVRGKSEEVLKALSDRKKAGGISQHVIDDMLASANILDVLEREYDLYFEAGSKGWWNTNCPLPGHDDSSPSFGVHPESGMYHCFGCGGKGTLLTFIQKVEGLSFPEAVARLSMITGIDINEEQSELHRTVRDIKAAINDYLSRSAETDLPGGMSEPAFLRAVAARIREFEAKSGHQPDAILFADSLYKEMDQMIYQQNHKGLANFWAGLGKRMRDKLASIRETRGEAVHI